MFDQDDDLIRDMKVPDERDSDSCNTQAESDEHRDDNSDIKPASEPAKMADIDRSSEIRHTNTRYTIRKYRTQFITGNKDYGLTKMRGKNPQMSYVRPRLKVPADGCPAIFICEGVQCCSYRKPRLLCPGVTLRFLQSKTFVVVGCIWVRVGVVCKLFS